MSNKGDDKKFAQMFRDWRANSELWARNMFGFIADPWQRETFRAWDRGDQRIALKACKGPGKTTMLALLIWHFLMLRDRPKVGATSITGRNLDDGLWTELAKWQSKSVFLKNKFTWGKERIFCNQDPEQWYASARSWSQQADSQQQADALAGLHADYILFVLDEVGGIPQAVMSAADAVLASGIESRILIAGNPTESSGPLYRACTHDKAIWTVIEITGDPDDPKRSTRVSMEWAKQQIAMYGRDNPWVMANVFGQFPPGGFKTFVPPDLVAEARKRPAVASMHDALVVGVDVARFGQNKTVLFARKGLDARTHLRQQYRGLSSTEVAAKIAETNEQLRPDAFFIDAGGVGGPALDICRNTFKMGNVFGVDFGGAPDRGLQGDDKGLPVFNKGMEMWAAGREWMKYGALPDDDELCLQLTQRHFEYKAVKGRDTFMLLPKEKERDVYGLDLWDDSDAFMLTFAYPVQATHTAGREAASHTMPRAVVSDYDPFREMHQQEAA